MARFTQKTKAKTATGPLKAKAKKPTTTYEGGSGYEKSAKTELYNRVLTERFSDTFYENAEFRSNRMVELATKLAKKDPVWFSKMVPWLRTEDKVRSASVLMAAIYANAQSGVDPLTLPDGALSVRKVVDGACDRADDPVELVAAYMSLYGRSLPRGLEKGIADAVNRLWNEYSVLKYNRSGATDMRDVINLCHLKGEGFREALFGYIIDTRYGNDINADDLEQKGLDLIADRMRLNAMPTADRKQFALDNPEKMKGLTWEFIASWLGSGGMDADGWTIASRQMNYFALLRNLRNIEAAGCDRSVLTSVRERIADPEVVAKSKLYPYRFYTAKRFSESDFFASALGDAFNAAVKNVEPLSGRTLVMVDGSSSMGGWYYNNSASKIAPIEQAGVFAAIAHSAWDADVWTYDTRTFENKFTNRYSTLSNAEQIFSRAGGGGTRTWPCIQDVLSSKPKGYYSRILVLTDMQDHPGGQIPDFEGNIFVWDLTGYSAANMATDSNRHLLGGFSDASFETIQRLEQGSSVTFGWMAE